MCKYVNKLERVKLINISWILVAGDAFWQLNKEPFVVCRIARNIKDGRLNKSAINHAKKGRVLTEHNH